MTKEVKISDIIIDKISGEWGEEVNGEPGIKVLRTTNFTNDGFLNLENVVERKIKSEVVEKKKLKPGDVIIEKSGGSPNQPVGRVVYFDETDVDYLCNNFTAILRPSKEVFPKYFFYALFYLHLSKGTLRYQNKTTGILNLKLERYLNEEKIPLPDLKTQKEIAHVLVQADKARQQRKAANALTDQFLQSSFLSIFGDPVKNEMGWQMKRFDEISESRLGKMLDGKQQTGKYRFKYLGNSNVKWGAFDLSDLLEMDFTENDRETFSLRTGDLLICEGGEVGRTAIWREEINNCYFQKALHRVRLTSNQALPEYILRLMWFYAQFDGFKDSVSSATIPHLTGVKLKAMNVPVPPLSLQQQFVAIVAQAEQLRQKQRESERELENLFQGLLQRYFG